MLGIPYEEIGQTLALVCLAVLAVVLIVRFVMSFRNYIYTGEFGKPECSWLGQMMEGNTMFSKYIFTGYHPGTVFMDGFFLGLVCLLMVTAWAPIIIFILIVLLAKQMRKRIAHKQEFVDSLKGNHLE